MSKEGGQKTLGDVVLERARKSLVDAQHAVENSPSEICTGVSSAIKYALRNVDKGAWAGATYWINDAIPHVNFCAQSLSALPAPDYVSPLASPGTS